MALTKNDLIVQEGNRVRLKKPHPCGGNTFVLERLGMDCRLKCEKCGATVKLMRRDFDKRLVAVISD